MAKLRSCRAERGTRVRVYPSTTGWSSRDVCAAVALSRTCIRVRLRRALRHTADA